MICRSAHAGGVTARKPGLVLKWTVRDLSLDANHRLQTRHLSRDTCLLGRLDHRRDILVSAGRFFSHASKGGTADQDPPAGQFVDELARRGILIRSPSFRGVAEEAPGAYKDVATVVEAAEKAGIARKVARLEPMVCIKG